MDNFESHHKSLDNLDLVTIVYFDRKKYKLDAKKSAKKTIQERGLSDQEIVQLKSIVRSRKKEERRNELRAVKEEKGWLFWILDILSNIF